MQIVSTSDWLAARKTLLVEEKALKRQQDALAKARREMPLVRVDKPYRFQTEEGEATLANLFQDQPQLIVYHFMFGEDWSEGCPSCSLWMDHFSNLIPHLRARSTSFVCVSSAPLAKLLSYRSRLGWSFPWVSSGGTGFGEDFGVYFREDAQYTEGYNYSGQPGKGELPGLSVFQRGDDGSVLHSYSTYARGLEPLNSVYAVLDMTPLGRNEEGLAVPMAWVKRRDQY